MNARPKRPSADITRKTILLAAKEIFLEKGFNGAYIKDIAKLADVNTNLIFHHFSNKATLWNTVKDFLLGEDIPMPHYNKSSAKAFFKSVLDYRFNLYAKHPEFAALIKWEALFKHETALISTKFYSPLHWLPIIEDLQQSGKIISSIDAKQIMLFIIF